ncbi:MAG: hypothetical protein ABIH25_00760 [Candidatus Woesearchaeota archaeon]
MDVAIALVIVFTSLLVASTFVTKANKDPLPNLQLLKYGSDISRVLDYKGYLDTPDTSQINNEIQRILPNYYDIELKGDGPGSCNFYVGNIPPENKAIISGKYYFNSENEICTLKYKIWLK